MEWSEAERNRAGNFSEMEKIWVEWSSLTSEHFPLQKRSKHRLYRLLQRNILLYANGVGERNETVKLLLHPADYEVGGTRSVATKSFSSTSNRALNHVILHQRKFHFKIPQNSM